MSLITQSTAAAVGNGGEQWCNNSPEVPKNTGLMGYGEQRWNVLVVPVEEIELFGQLFVITKISLLGKLVYPS